MDFESLESRLLALHRAEEFDDALALLDEHEASLPHDAATLHYWRACLLARSGDRAGAIAVLQRALDAGYWYRRAGIESDDDFAPLHDDAAFSKIVRVCGELESRARRVGPPSPLVLEPDTPADASPALVAFHPAGSSPQRFAHHWEEAARAGWEVVLPCASNSVASDSYVWLDRDLRRLDVETARRALRDGLPDVAAAAGADVGRQVILAGFGQGGAVALLVSLLEGLRSPRVLVIGATARHAEAIDAVDIDAPVSKPRIHAVVGREDPGLEDTQEAMRRLEERSLDVTVEVREGLGHEFPPQFPLELRECLDGLASK